MIVGDLPSYEAFPIGGTNSVRGYGEGGVGSGRNYVAGTLEAHMPLVAPLEATFFADYGSGARAGLMLTCDSSPLNNLHAPTRTRHVDGAQI